MSRKELVFLATRFFALLLIAWALIDITYLPERLFALLELGGRTSVFSVENQWDRYHLLTTILSFIRVTLLLLAAARFWKCGPLVERLFSAQPGSEHI